MITTIKDNIGKVLSDDELTTLETRVGDDVSSIVANNTTKWSNDIFLAVSEDNIRNRRFAKAQDEARATLRELLAQERESRNHDRRETLLALHRAIDKIAAQQAELKDIKTSPQRLGPLIQTKHEQVRG